MVTAIRNNTGERDLYLKYKDMKLVTDYSPYVRSCRDNPKTAIIKNNVRDILAANALATYVEMQTVTTNNNNGYCTQLYTVIEPNARSNNHKCKVMCFVPSLTDTSIIQASVQCTVAPAYYAIQEIYELAGWKSPMPQMDYRQSYIYTDYDIHLTVGSSISSWTVSGRDVMPFFNKRFSIPTEEESDENEAYNDFREIKERVIFDPGKYYRISRGGGASYKLQYFDRDSRARIQTDLADITYVITANSNIGFLDDQPRKQRKTMELTHIGDIGPWSIDEYTDQEAIAKRKRKGH